MASRSGYPGGSPAASSHSLASSALPRPGSTAVEKTETELEAERLWWSEASERQVKDLEASFGSAFRKTAEKLSNDVASCRDRLERLIEAEREQRAGLLADLSADVFSRQDRLEVLVEGEKGQRTSALLDLKRGLDVQELALAELRQQQHQELQRLEARLEDRLHNVLRELSGDKLASSAAASADQAALHDTQKLMNRLRSDFDTFQVQASSKDASLRADVAHSKAQVSTMEGAIEDLKRKLGSSKQDHHASVEASITDIRRDLAAVLETQKLSEACASSSLQDRNAAVEASITDIRRELAVVLETQKASEAGPSSSLQEQIEALQTMAGDFRRFQDAQKAHDANADSLLEELRQEASALRSASESRAKTDEEVRAFHEVIMQSTCDLGRGLEEISGTVVVAEERLRKEIEDIRARVAGLDLSEALNASCGRLAKSVEDERSSRSSDLLALSARIDVAFEQLEAHQAPLPGMVTNADLEKLHGAVEADVQALRGQLEAAVQAMNEQVEALKGEFQALGAVASQGQAADALGEEARRVAEELVAACRERISGLEQDLARRLDEERAERSAQIGDLQHEVKASVSLRQAEAQQPQAPVVVQPVVDSGLSQAVAEVRNELRLMKVAVQVLEQRCQESAVSEPWAQEFRTFALRLDQADGEVQRFMGSVSALAARVDACENEVWRTSSDTPAIKARLDLLESDVNRIVREGGDTSTDVAALRGMFGSMKADADERAQRAEDQLTTPSALATPPSDKSTVPLAHLASRTLSSKSIVAGISNPMADQVRVIAPPATGTPPSERAAVPPSAALQSLSANTTTAGGSSGPMSEPEPSNAPPPMLSADLKASIGQLVKRVNATLSARPVPEAADPLAVAAHAIQEMREANLTLREENVGLAEELLSETAAARPSQPASSPQHLARLSTGPGSFVPTAGQPWQAVTRRLSQVGQPLTGLSAPSVPLFNADGHVVPAVSLAGSVAFPMSGSVRVPPSASSSVVVPHASAASYVAQPATARRESSPVRNLRTVSPVRATSAATARPASPLRQSVRVNLAMPGMQLGHPAQAPTSTSDQRRALP